MTTRQNRTRRGRLQTNLLKVVLTGGAIVSTFLGGRLLSQADQVAIEPAAGQQLIIPEPRENRTITVNDAPIPEVVMPRPVTRSRSSR